MDWVILLTRAEAQDTETRFGDMVREERKELRTLRENYVVEDKRANEGLM